MVKLHQNVQKNLPVLYLMERISNVKSGTYPFNQGTFISLKQSQLPSCLRDLLRA